MHFAVHIVPRQPRAPNIAGMTSWEIATGKAAPSPESASASAPTAPVDMSCYGMSRNLETKLSMRGTTLMSKPAGIISPASVATSTTH